VPPLDVAVLEGVSDGRVSPSGSSVAVAVPSAETSAGSLGGVGVVAGVDAEVDSTDETGILRDPSQPRSETQAEMTNGSKRGKAGSIDEGSAHWLSGATSSPDERGFSRVQGQRSRALAKELCPDSDVA
jgi:hypothetical protein